MYLKNSNKTKNYKLYLFKSHSNQKIHLSINSKIKTQNSKL